MEPAFESKQNTSKQPEAAQQPVGGLPQLAHESHELASDFGREVKDYRRDTGRDLTQDLRRFGTKNDAGEYVVENEKPVKEAVLKLLKAPEGASIVLSCTQNGSALNNDRIEGLLELDGIKDQFVLDLKAGSVEVNGQPIDREKELAGELRRVRVPESSSSAPHAIVGAMEAMEEFLGEDRDWTFPAGDQAGELRRRLAPLRTELPRISDYVSSIAQQGGVDRVNEFLREHGFDIQLRDPDDRRSVAAASVVDVQVKWERPGEETQLRVYGQPVPAVRLRDIERIYRAEGHEHPIVEISTEGNERFFITRCEDALAPGDQFRAYGIATRLAQARQSSRETYAGGVEFPMADYQASGKMDWLIGATTVGKDGLPAVISEALYQHRFRLNAEGARGEAAAALGATRGSTPPRLVIDGSYLAWFETSGGAAGTGAIPFAARVGREHMKNPAGLD